MIKDCDYNVYNHNRRSIDIYFDKNAVYSLQWGLDFPIKITRDDGIVIDSTIGESYKKEWWLRRTDSNKKKNRLPDWLRSLDLDHNGIIEFYVIAPDHLKYRRVVNVGSPHPRRP